MHRPDNFAPRLCYTRRATSQEIAEMIRLYDYLPSGNGYKVRLLLTGDSKTQVPAEHIFRNCAPLPTHPSGFSIHLRN
jgi:hypothetical protein